VRFLVASVSPHGTLLVHPCVHAVTMHVSLLCLPLSSWQPQGRDLGSLLVLMVHAGRDWKRVPWANPIGKPFIPFPLLAGDDPEGPSLTLFDHILAVSALARTAFNTQSELGSFPLPLPCFTPSCFCPQKCLFRFTRTFSAKQRTT